jgi:hypothetical protein
VSGPGALESANIEQVEMLNQRGGRTLSFVDLILDGTLSAEMAGELAALVEGGASILTAARLGGVGKSTVLADLLGCLPPGERIVTTAQRADVEAAAREPGPSRCFLAHEIGRGPYYAYLWGSAAAGFFELAAAGTRIATCLHADVIEEAYGILQSQDVSAAALRSIGMIVFIKRFDRRRRIDAVYVPGPKAHRVRWLWDESDDAFVPHGASPVDAARAQALADVFAGLVDREVREFAEVRATLAKVLTGVSA